MGIFFSLCDSYLFFMICLEDLAKCVYKIVIFKNYMDIFKCMIISRHGSIIQIQRSHFIFRKRSLGKDFGDFPASVCTKIKTYNRISIFYCGTGCMLIYYREQKFIGYIIPIRCFYGSKNII